jgi:hypothetical protein
VEGLSEYDREIALQEYRRQCKKFMDCLQRRQLGRSEDSVNPDILYTGVTDPCFRTMAEVSAARLRKGDTFPTKVLLSMQFLRKRFK